MKKFIFTVFSGLLLCYLGGALKEGAAFLAAFTVFSLPQTPRLSPFAIAIAGLSAGCAAAIVGESAMLFWGMFILAMAGLSLKSLAKTAALGLVALASLRLGTEARIWLPVFFAAVYSAFHLLIYDIGKTGRVFADKTKLDK